MNSNSNNKNSDFKSSDEAFEHLINERLDEKRKEEWAKALGPPRDEAPRQVKKPKASRKILFRVASIAAIVLLLLGFFLFAQKTEPLDQYAGVLMQELDITIDYGSAVRGENSVANDMDVTSLKNELTSVLLDKDFNQALGYFKQMEKMTTLTIEDKYFFAVSLLKTKGEDYQKALRLLSDVVQGNDQNKNNAIWLKALAYGMTDNAPLMKSELNKIKSNSTKFDNRVNDLLSKY